MIIHEFLTLLESANNVEKYEPICFARENLKNEFILSNFNASSSTSNDTGITTNETVFIFGKDKKCFLYMGTTYILNCEMSVIDVNFATQVLQWYNNDPTIRVVGGKEYISSDSSEVIYLFKISKVNAKIFDDFAWKGGHEKHTPVWFKWASLVLGLALVFFLARTTLTSLTGRTIKGNLRNDLLEYNNGERVDISKRLLEIVDEPVFTFKDVSQFVFRGQKDLENLREGRDLFEKELQKAIQERPKERESSLDSITLESAESDVEETIKIYLDNYGEGIANYDDLIKKLLQKTSSIKDFKGWFVSNISVLENAMRALKHSVLIKNEINELRAEDGSEEMKQNIDAILNEKMPLQNVEGYGNKVLKKLQALKESSGTVQTQTVVRDDVKTNTASSRRYDDRIKIEDDLTEPLLKEEEEKLEQDFVEELEEVLDEEDVRISTSTTTEGEAGNMFSTLSDYFIKLFPKG